MTKKVSVVVLAAALALLAGCTTAPTSTSGDAASSPGPNVASMSSGSPAPEAALPGAPGASAPLDIPDSLNKDFGTYPNQAGGPALKELERGQASWYGPRFHGRRTASGERYDQQAMTAAHKTLPFGSLVRVRSLVTGKEIDVRINDRGPFTRGRVIDVSRAAAEALGMTGLGVKQVLLLVAASGPGSRGNEVPVAGKMTH